MTTRGEINSNFYQIVNVDANGAPTSVKPEYLPNVGNANYAANAGHANISDVANLVAVANVSGIGNIATINLSGNGSQVLLGNGTWGAGGGANANYANFAGTAFNVSGSNVSGAVNLANYATVANSVAVANVSGIGNIATVNLDGNSSNVLYGNGVFSAATGGANANYANFAGSAFGANLTVQTANTLGTRYIPFVSSNAGGNLQLISDVNFRYNGLNGGTIITGAFQGNGSLLSSITGANVTGFVANANTSNTTLGVNVTDATGTLGTRYITFANTSAGGNQQLRTHTSLTFSTLGTGTLSAGAFSGNGSLLTGINGSNVTGQVANALVAGTVYSNAQPNITSVGTLTNLSVTGNITGGHISGSASGITGLSLTDSNFTDVLVTSPTNQQVLQYNGSTWVNNTLNIPTSGGSGVNFWFTTPVILPVSSNNEVQLDTLNNTPNTTAVQTASVNINNTTKVIMGTVTAPLNRTQFDAGNWSFDICAYANTAGAGTRTIQPVTYQVNPGTGTVTITGTGTTRTVTASTGTPFANSTGSANLLLCSHLQTPTGLFQINTKSSDTVVTIDVPSTYVNETSVSYYVYDKFFNLDPVTVSATSTTPTVYNFNTTASSLPVSLTTRLGVLIVGTTNNNKILNVNYNDTTQSSHISTPFITLHDDLAGLQGGQTDEYYHLTSSEYTGTGSGVFVKDTSPVLTTPNIGAATGTSLNLTGNLIAGNITGGNLVSANYISGNGSLLTSITGANITGTVANATHADFADVANSVAGANVSGYVANASHATIADSANSVAGANVSGYVANASHATIADSANSVSAANISGTVNLANYATVANSVAVANVSGIGNIATINLTGSSSNVLYGNGVFAPATTGGDANYANFAGNVVNASQPNITSLGTLVDLNVSGNINGNTALYIGYTSNSTGLTNPVIVAKAGGATYVQSSVVNGTAEGSADLVAYGDNGTDAGAWADIGFTGSNFSDPVYTITGKNDGYFFVLGDDASIYGGNLVIATGAQGTTRDIVFGTGGFQDVNEKMRLINNDNQFHIEMGTVSSNTTTGALVVDGGVGIGGDVYAGNIVSANYFVGNGSLLTGIVAANATHANYADVANSVAGSNVSGAVAYATTANSVAVANVVGIGNIATVNLTGSTSNVLYGNGVFAAIPTVSNVANANYSNFAGTAYNVSGSNVTGDVAGANHANVADSANSVAGINVTGTVANATYAITAGSATTAATVTTASQPNITSVGSLTSLTVTGNITSGNINGGNLVTGNYFTGNGSLLSSLTGANVTGTVANATYALSANTSNTSITVTGGSQPNITSLGTLSSLTVTGNVTGNYFIGNGSALTGVTATASPGGANTQIQFNDNGSTNGVAGLTFNKTSNLMSIGNTGSITMGLGTGTDFVTLNSPAGSGNIAAGGTVTAVNANISNVALTKFTETVSANANTSTSIAPNMANGTIVRYTANASFSFNGFTSPVAGQSGTVIITQDATGGRTMTSTMKFAGGSKTLSTAANAIDIICVFYDGTTYYATLSKGYA